MTLQYLYPRPTVSAYLLWAAPVYAAVLGVIVLVTYWLVKRIEHWGAPTAVASAQL